MQQHDTKRRFVRAKGLWLTYVLTLSGFTVRNLSNIPRSRSHWNSKWSKPFLCPLLSGCVFERSGVSAQVGPLCGGQTMPCRWETVTLDFGWKSFFLWFQFFILIRYWFLFELIWHEPQLVGVRHGSAANWPKQPRPHNQHCVDPRKLRPSVAGRGIYGTWELPLMWSSGKAIACCTGRIQFERSFCTP